MDGRCGGRMRAESKVDGKELEHGWKRWGRIRERKLGQKGRNSALI